MSRKTMETFFVAKVSIVLFWPFILKIGANTRW